MKTSFRLTRQFPLSSATLAILSAGICAATAQTDGKPGVDSSPADLRQPAAGTAGAAAPAETVPQIGGARPVELDPEAVQVDPAVAEKIASTASATASGGPSISAIISGSEDFTTLAGALKAADLSETLDGDGPFTLFAPDNKAFEALPEGVLKALLQPENQEILENILTFHVIPKRLLSADLKPGSFPTVNGAPATLDGGAEGRLTIQGAAITRSDVLGGNGVVHVVAQVLMPPDITVEGIEPAFGDAVVIEKTEETVVEEVTEETVVEEVIEEEVTVEE